MLHIRQAVTPAADATPTANNRLRIGILIVAYNAVGTLARVLQRIPDAVWENVEEVVVFDDASDDATYELAMGYRVTREMRKLRIFRNASNLGYGGNQKAGYKYFIENNFDVVVLLHGDGQYAPEILHHLYHPIVSGKADAVFGSRMMRTYGGALQGGMPLYKYVGNRILTYFENRSLGMHLTEFHSGYRAYSVGALRKLELSTLTNDFHFDTEIIIKLNHQGFRISEVPIPTYYGSEICYVNGMKYAADVFRAVKRYKSTVRSARKYPEFAEYFVRYPYKDDPHSSHGVARRLIGCGGRVLDVGCGDGHFAAAICENANEVTGIDIIPAPARRDAFKRYICTDMSSGLDAAARELKGTRFDTIAMLDVLQQLASPEEIVRQSAALLEPNGKLIVSLPNVANVTVRLALLFGTFNYCDRGILDRQHLRFFTRATARRMLERCGFRITRERPTVVPLEFILDLQSASGTLRVLRNVLAALTRIWPAFFAYQWVFEARARGD